MLICVISFLSTIICAINCYHKFYSASQVNKKNDVFTVYNDGWNAMW